MSANREEDKMINEAYLNQDGIGMEQQRDPNGNLKYPAKYDKQNSNLRQFYGLTNGAKVSDAAIGTMPDLSSDEEKETYGYIYKSEQTTMTPENPEIVVVGLGRYDLESLEKNIRSQLSKLSEDNVSNIVYGLTKEHSPLITKIKAMQQVLKKMETPQYKRKISLAKRKRSSYNLKYGEGKDKS